MVLIENKLISNIKIILFLITYLWIFVVKINDSNEYLFLVTTLLLILVVAKKLKIKIATVKYIFWGVILIFFYVKIYSFLFIEVNNIENLNKVVNSKKEVVIEVKGDIDIDEKRIKIPVSSGGKKYQFIYYLENSRNNFDPDKVELKNEKEKNGSTKILTLAKKIKYGNQYKVKIVKAKKIINKHNNPSSFDYQKYMKSQGISYEIVVKNPKQVGYHLTIRNTLENIRKKMIIKNQEFNPLISPYINALIFGEKTFDLEYQKTLSLMGIIQLFTISGLHINIILGGLEQTLYRFNITKRKVKKIILILGPLYIILAGSGVSVVRAIEMKIISDFYEDNAGPNSHFIILIAVLLINLGLNPFLIANLGFCLTYLITGLLILNSYILSAKETEHLYIQSIRTTMGINLMLIPFFINLNYTLNLGLIIFMYVYEKIVKIMLVLSGLIILASILQFNLLTNITSIGYEGVVDILNAFLIFNYQIVWKIGHLNPFLLYYYYTSLWQGISRYYLFQKIEVRFIYQIAIILLIASNPYHVLGKVIIIDIGQGDSILIEMPFSSKNVLIDTGPKSSKTELINFLQYENIKTIDYLVLTHMHEDHIGNAQEVIEKFKVKNLVINKAVYQNQKQQLKKATSEWKSKEKQMKLILVANLQKLTKNITIYAPEKYSKNLNNNSLIIRGTFGQKKWLFTGDAEVLEEKELIKKYGNYLDIDYLKLGHHGSKTSTTDELLKETTPSKGFISSGKNNLYKHPSLEIINKLNGWKIKYQDTQNSGAIVVFFL